MQQLRFHLPQVLHRRLESLQQDHTLAHAILTTEGPAKNFRRRVSFLARGAPPHSYWRENIVTMPMSMGLQDAAHDQTSRAWLRQTPRGWTGRDFVRAVQLRTANLATKSLPYIPAGERRCRAGCNKIESLAHVLQACPVTHHEHIKRHNSIVAKVARHCRRRGWTTEVEPRVRHADSQLFIPDLAVHQPSNTTTICDVQVW